MVFEENTTEFKEEEKRGVWAKHHWFWKNALVSQLQYFWRNSISNCKDDIFSTSIFISPLNIELIFWLIHIYHHHIAVARFMIWRCPDQLLISDQWSCAKTLKVNRQDVMIRGGHRKLPFLDLPQLLVRQIANDLERRLGFTDLSTWSVGSTPNPSNYFR